MKNNKKNARLLVLLFAFTYFVSYVTRTNYSSIISAMVEGTGLSKSMLSTALTGSFVTYGAGQLISGYFGDKVQPKALVCTGLFITVTMNMLVPFCVNQLALTILWCINGFAQSMMWPPLVRLMSAFFEGKAFTRANVHVSWGGLSGTMFIYLLSPMVISLMGWKWVFILSGVIGIIGIIIWLKLCPLIKSKPAEVTVNEKTSVLKVISPLILGIMLAIVLQGILRDGVTTWMPSYISETYGIGAEISILTGVLLPIFSIITLQVVEKLYSAHFKNPVSCSAVIFGVGSISALMLYLFCNKSPVLSVGLSTIITGCMHGANFALVCIIPKFYEGKGLVSTVSGLLNSCTYVGSALSAYLFPLVSERAGWSATLLLWVAIALAGTIICMSLIPAWRKNK